MFERPRTITTCPCRAPHDLPARVIQDLRGADGTVAVSCRHGRSRIVRLRWPSTSSPAASGLPRRRSPAPCGLDVPPRSFVRFQALPYYARGVVGRRLIATLSEPPLPTLLGRALSAFAGDYDSARGEDRSILQLGVWANALRTIEAEGTDQTPTRSSGGDLEASGRGRGQPAREARPGLGRGDGGPGQARQDENCARHGGRQGRAKGRCPSRRHRQEDWRQRFRQRRHRRLRDAPSSVVDQPPVELPHYVTGYGVGDPSVVGGDYVLEAPGPPRIPARPRAAHTKFVPVVDSTCTNRDPSTGL